MQKLLNIPILFFCFLLFNPVAISRTPIAISDQNSMSRSIANYVPGEILIKFRNGIPRRLVEEAHRRLGVQVIKDFTLTGGQHCKLPQNLTVEDAIKEYSKNPNVEYV